MEILENENTGIYKRNRGLCCLLLFYTSNPKQQKVNVQLNDELMQPSRVGGAEFHCAALLDDDGSCR